MAQVKLDQIQKRFGDTTILHGISCDIRDGEFIVVVGPSGCGKSTLLRIVAGLETASAGAIHIGEREVTKLEPKDRDIAMVFQNYALYPHMTVAENMAYGLKNRGTDKAEIETRVAQAADILQLGPYLSRRPKQLSGGQRQRVAMGRAIVREPKLFLFDEPLSNLDAKLRVQMRVEIKKLQQRLGVTALYVTHDQVEAMTMADRLIVMKDGRAEQIGAPLDLYARPETVFVAGFIGSPAMNLLPGEVTAEGAVRLACGPTLDLPQPLTGMAGRKVLLGVRPEHLGVRPGGAFTVTVDLVEALGADTLVYATLADGSSLTARLDGAQVVARGDQLALTPANTLHVFDAASGLRVN